MPSPLSRRLDKIEAVVGHTSPALFTVASWNDFYEMNREVAHGNGGGFRLVAGPSLHDPLAGPTLGLRSTAERDHMLGKLAADPLPDTASPLARHVRAAVVEALQDDAPFPQFSPFMPGHVGVVATTEVFAAAYERSLSRGISLRDRL